MQVVLRDDLDKVGKRGDIVVVADGYARNYLIPRGHAIRATKGIAAQATAMRAGRDRIDAKNRTAAQAVATKLAGANVEIQARAGEGGKLFGSVTDSDVVEAIKARFNIEVERRQVERHEHIKSVGEHQVQVKLHSDVTIPITIAVVAEGSS